MDKTDAQQMANDLRAFADFVENHGPNLGVDFYIPTVGAFIYDEQEYNYETQQYDVKVSAKDRMSHATRVLVRAVGNVRKNWNGGYLEVEAKFGETVVFEMNIPRDKICKRVVTGTEEIPERIVPATTREVVEWVCDDPAILNLAS